MDAMRQRVMSSGREGCVPWELSIQEGNVRGNSDTSFMKSSPTMIAI